MLQFVCWLAYLVVVLTFFLRPSGRTQPARPRAPIFPATAQIRHRARIRFNHRKVNHVNRSVPFVAAAAALLAGVALTGCTAKEAATTTGTGDNAAAAPAEVTVAATDAACELSATEGTTGANTFVITNNGNKVTEFYVYGEGERVMGEVENISPGLNRKLIVQLPEPGTYQTACKPGMVGDGIRGDFKVTGDTVRSTPRANSKRPPTTTSATSTARPTP